MLLFRRFQGLVAMVELTEREIVQAVSRISSRAAPPSGADVHDVVGFSLTELQAFAKSVRTVKSELTDALVNKMFYSCTPRHIFTVDDAINALQHPQYGYDWKNILSRALTASRLSSTALSSPRRSSPRQSDVPSSPRNAYLATVVGAVQQAHETTSPRNAASEFPPWSVHSSDTYNDPFDKLRVNRNGVSLRDARLMDDERKQKELRRILPNEYGAIVVQHSPRNMGQGVVVVDATAERERMKRAQLRQAELGRLLALGGTSVEKYLKNELTLPGNHDTVHPTSDPSYRQTMTAIVDFLSSPRKKS